MNGTQVKPKQVYIGGGKFVVGGRRWRHQCTNTTGTSAWVTAKLGYAFVYMTLMGHRAVPLCINSCHLCLDIRKQWN